MNEAKLRQAGPNDIRLMLEWAAMEGWNPGVDDAEPFYAADPKGFFVAEVDGKPVAAISVVNHSDEFAFLGFYICRPEFRGRGIGFALWRHALEHAGDRTVGLDGVETQQENYARSGFKWTGATVRHEGVLAAMTDPRVRDFRGADLAAIEQLDRSANGISRTSFLSAWVAPVSTRRTLVLDTPAGVSGFATIRRCREGFKIGPIIAPDTASALTLAAAAAAVFQAQKSIIDVPADKTDFISRLKAIGFEKTFATARMYRGAAPSTGPGLQAIGSMELG